MPAAALPDHPGTEHQAVRYDCRFSGRLPKDRQKVLRQAHASPLSIPEESPAEPAGLPMMRKWLLLVNRRPGRICAGSSVHPRDRPALPAAHAEETSRHPGGGCRSLPAMALGARGTCLRQCGTPAPQASRRTRRASRKPAVSDRDACQTFGSATPAAPDIRQT